MYTQKPSTFVNRDQQPRDHAAENQALESLYHGADDEPQGSIIGIIIIGTLAMGTIFGLTLLAIDIYMSLQ